MIKTKILLSTIFICAQFYVTAQDQEQKNMRSFVPKSQAYDIYYPLEFKLLEGEDGIVTFTDSITGLNITISSYILEKKPKDVDLITLLNSFINDSYNKQHKIKDWNSYKTKFDNLVELKTTFEDANWVWYGISIKKSVVILSINKDTEINRDDLSLVKFMLDNMIIN
jgi:hypothetical protein